MHEDWRGAGDVKEWRSPSFHFLSGSRLDSDIFSAPADVLCLSPVLFLILNVSFSVLFSSSPTLSAPPSLIVAVHPNLPPLSPPLSSISL